MRPILILTRNLLAEQRLQTQLQCLNYEVFCSVEMLKLLLQHPNNLEVIKSYQAIIFSETLTNQEVDELRGMVVHKDNLLIRKFNQEPLLDEQEELAELNIDVWIYDGQPLAILREQLSAHLARCQNKGQDNVLFLYQREDPLKTLVEFKKGLSKKERLTFECLMESETGQVSRDRLCQYLWQGDANASRLTQISVLIKRLKHKLEEIGFQEGMIETVWGYGYRLSPQLLQLYKQEAVK